MTLKLMTWVLIGSTALSSAAFAQSASEKPADTTDAVGDIIVTARQGDRTVGNGALRLEVAPSQIQTVTRAAMDDLSPGANPVALIANLPSVNVNMADAFGLQGGSNVQMHGLPAANIGWLLDGMPQSYNGAAYAMEMVDSENLERVSVAPGSSNLADPTINSAAGTIYLSMRAPADDFGARIQVAGGNRNYNRQYLRVDTGEIGSSDIRGFISYSHSAGDNYRGYGSADNMHVDMKFVKTFDNGSYITVAGAFHRLDNDNYLNYPTKAQAATGYNALSYNLTDQYTSINSTNYYRMNGQHPYYVGLFWMPMRAVISDELTIDNTPYYWFGVGGTVAPQILTQGSTFSGTQRFNVDLTRGGTVPLTGNRALTAIVGRGSYIQYGDVLKLTYKTGNHEFVAGAWYEHSDVKTRRIISAVNQTSGTPADLWDRSNYYRLPNGAIYHATKNDVYYDTFVLFAGDTVSMFDDRLKVTAGIKYAFTKLAGVNLLPGTTENVSMTANTPLPRFSISFDATPNLQIYANVQRDFRLPSTLSIMPRYGVTSGFRSQGARVPEPETAWKEEAGIRFHNDLLIADLSFFNIYLKNRLLTLAAFDNGVLVPLNQNAGSQRSRGVDFQIGTVPLGGVFSPYVGFEYLDAKIMTDTVSSTTTNTLDFLPTKGKTQIQSPRVQIMGGANLKLGGFFIGGRVRYVGSQYATLVNDEKISSYITNDINFGYEFEDWGGLKKPKVQVNIANIGDERFLSGVYSYASNARAVTGRNGGTIPAGFAPQYYLQPPFSAAVSFSANF